MRAIQSCCILYANLSDQIARGKSAPTDILLYHKARLTSAKFKYVRPGLEGSQQLHAEKRI